MLNLDSRYNCRLLKSKHFLAALCGLSLVLSCYNHANAKLNLDKKQNEALYQQAISHAERSASDKIKDKSRRPDLVLPFTLLKQGDKVLELAASGGHTTELISRVVGDSGKVYAQALSPYRLAEGRLPNVIALRKHLLYQLPDILKENAITAESLDKVIIFYSLHDLYLNSRIDKQGLYKTLLDVLKPQGHFIVLDNAADEKAGNTVNASLHRIGVDFVVNEITKAGFSLDIKSDVLKNPNDDHSKPWQSFAGNHDRFALRFKKN